MCLLIYYIRFVTVGGHPTVQIARHLGITPHLLRHWKQEVAGDSLTDFAGKGRRTPHKEELAELKGGLGHVTQERDLFQQCGAVLRLAKYATNLGYLLQVDAIQTFSGIGCPLTQL